MLLIDILLGLGCSIAGTCRKMLEPASVCGGRNGRLEIGNGGGYINISSLRPCACDGCYIRLLEGPHHPPCPNAYYKVWKSWNNRGGHVMGSIIVCLVQRG